MRLADLPDVFDLEELKKGYLPHLYNRKENQNIILEHPTDMEYYNPNAMKPEDRIEYLFIKWINRNQSENFDFQTKILSNCRSDVDILRHACLRFRKMFIEITAKEGTPGIDPFESCITIASVCNLAKSIEKSYSVD